MPEVTSTEWDEFSQGMPDAHILQSQQWGRLKQAFGWEPVQILSKPHDGIRIGAQVLFRKTPLYGRIAYIPKGPPGWPHQFSNRDELWHKLLAEIDQACKLRQTIFIILEPDAWKDELPNPPDGFTPGSQGIQPPRTIILDLADGEETTLLRMKQKTRYNIRLAEKKGVIVRPTNDIVRFHQLMSKTGSRDGFGIHSLEYYQRVYEAFQPRQECELFIAEFQDEPLAGIMVFRHGKRAWYFYGASSDEHRNLMPSYLAQWQAICWAIQHSCEEYDLWGVPDETEDTLEANFSTRNDGLWGVYRFKRGFGGSLRRSAGPFVRVYQPSLYSLYRLWLKLSRRTEGG